MLIANQRSADTFSPISTNEDRNEEENNNNNNNNNESKVKFLFHSSTFVIL